MKNNVFSNINFMELCNNCYFGTKETDFENPRYTLAKMGSDKQFMPSKEFLDYCLEKGYVEAKEYNEYFNTITFKIFWKKVSNEWPKIED